MPVVYADYHFTYEDEPYASANVPVGEAETMFDELRCEDYLRGVLQDASIDPADLGYEADAELTLSDLSGKGFFFNTLNVYV